MTDRMQVAQQLRRTLQMFAESLTAEEAMEVPYVFDPWEADKPYRAGDRLIYGENGVGDPQLYEVVQAHTSQAGWTPDTLPALYEPIGLNAAGYPIWAAPTGSHDAYSTGDIVEYEDVLYVSQIDGNTTVPGTDDRYWRVYADV